MSSGRELVRLSDLRSIGAGQVWTPPSTSELAYSDGRGVEEFLMRVMESAGDLGSESRDLERHIRDWPTMYHLSPIRGRLLKEFSLNQEARVLEIGAGCGALTRLLGERFKEVVAVEGSQRRASIARKRTKGMSHVSVVNARFEQLRFDERFDVITLIGVFEYASMLEAEGDPHDHVLNLVADALAPNGQLVLAIENQFGLKYFAGEREDHTGVRYDGLEGYVRVPRKARTFGLNALRARLAHYFEHSELFFPYPDYKLPACVLSEELFDVLNPAELLATYCRSDEPELFDQPFVIRELMANNLLPTFANSFLVISGNKQANHISAPWLGVLFADQRVPQFRSVTRLRRTNGGTVTTEKVPLASPERVTDGPVTLHATRSEWLAGPSVHQQILVRAKERGVALESLVAPAMVWLDSLRSLARTVEGKGNMVPGRFLDCTWRNTFASAGGCAFIDLEWEWSQEIPLEVLVIRAITEFVKDASHLRGLTPVLRASRPITVVKRIAQALGVSLDKRHFADFYSLNSRFTKIVRGDRAGKHVLRTRLAFEVPLLSWIARHSRLAVRRIRVGWARVARAVE